VTPYILPAYGAKAPSIEYDSQAGGRVTPYILPAYLLLANIDLEFKAAYRRRRVIG